VQPMYNIGLDVHKRKISYCVKDGDGQIHAEGSISGHPSGPGPLDALASAAISIPLALCRRSRTLCYA
jgi:hypothetical protein